MELQPALTQFLYISDGVEIRTSWPENYYYITPMAAIDCYVGVVAVWEYLHLYASEIKTADYNNRIWTYISTSLHNKRFWLGRTKNVFFVC